MSRWNRLVSVLSVFFRDAGLALVTVKQTNTPYAIFPSFHKVFGSCHIEIFLKLWFFNVCSDFLNLEQPNKHSDQTIIV